MVMILAKYGCPSNLYDTITKMYKKSVVKLVIGEFETTIDFKVGIKQGDSVAPVLFLFIVMAFSKTLEKEWTLNGPTKAKFSRKNNSPLSDGQLTSHPPRSFDRGALFELFCMLYVDDGAFVLELRHQLETVTPLLLRYFEKFGLEMHIGKENKTSKTECFFFRTPGYFTLPTLPNSDARTTTSPYLNSIPFHSDGI